MTFTPVGPLLEDGVPGLEALHTLNPPGSWPPFTINDWMDPATGLVQLPHSRLQTITGLYDKPDSDDPRVNLVNQIGELAFPRQQRGKSIVYTGVVVGRTLAELRHRVAALRAAASIQSQSPTGWTLSVAYDPTYDPTGLAFVAYGQPIAFTSDESGFDGDASPTAWQQVFILTFRMADPRFWLPASVVTAGGDDGSTQVLEMPGTAPSEPIFVVTGSDFADTPTTFLFQHAELGRQMQIILPQQLGGETTLTVDFLQRTVVQQYDEAEDMSGYIDWPNTDWWGEDAAASSLLVGTNTITCSSGGPNTWQVSANPAVW